MNIVSLVLAAGKGTRMKSELPKVLHKVNGVPMVIKIDSELKKAGISKNILILGHKKELVIKEFENRNINIDYVTQEEQLGTGHAIMQAKEVLKDFEGTVLVTCGDTPLIRNTTIEKFVNFHNEKKASATILTAKVDNPFGYGRIVKNEDKVIAIIEEKEASDDIKKINEINSGVYCFDSKKLFASLEKIDNNNEKGEYYLTDVIKILVNNNELVESYLLEDNQEILGVNSKVQLAEASQVLRNRKNIELMENGVIIIDPNTTYIEETVEIGKDTIIYPNVIIEGDTKIGNNSIIMQNSRIVDSDIADNVKIESSVIEESIIEEGVTIGPFAHLRPKAHLKENVHIGNFVEVKKSTLEKGVKAGHLSYIGDAEVGENTNFGAGTITCNYDGKNKHKTIIGKNVFIGSDTKFVAPVNIGDNSITGAGSVITKDVPEYALGLGRAKQLNIKEWRKKNDN
ncbi:MAG: bifunctional UDP-N-acetylglucosamine pyrophosphorylase / glucosamine-phosphate N-acetyltransferase [Fusobacteriaceae bacterium]|jgi:bifunctional UDP-N-acetylglucosamine pyrophosphorylase/glucosamine-1-phosphate N-acetyltransferase|nr:glucosamine-phosphate N-acetyltransferase [Fusobacteriales bacterium]MDN5304332.1 bifunctional UDP-N-acetylglucosamine pyrophosphorylase / glucosamine-phosphate N-acetyltransferase [Fusobacteriaceae bacterium]